MKFAFSKSLMGLALALIAVSASAQKSSTLKPNQTYGFGEGQSLVFTYTQNFDCIDQPNDDLNFNGIKAAVDPAEMQTPICQAGIEPQINPPGVVGNPNNTTEPLFVLVPMFSVDNDRNPNDAISCTGVVTGTLCGTTLGSTLISLFGAVPEAFKTTPLVYAQCPDPKSAPGTCTMHASRIDLGPVLVSLGYLPPPVANVFVPTPNHSHVVINADLNTSPIWWQVVPVLVLDQTDWPGQDGSTGINSVKALNAAISAGRAVKAPSNFFLFFSSVTATSHAAHLHQQ